MDVGFFFEVLHADLVAFSIGKMLGRSRIGEACDWVMVGLSVKFQLGGDKTGVAK